MRGSLRMLLNDGTLDGHRVLRADTVDLMAQNHIGDLEAGAMYTVAPPLSNDFDFFPGSTTRSASASSSTVNRWTVAARREAWRGRVCTTLTSGPTGRGGSQA